MLTVLVTSLFAVLIAEIGDKTQLLTLFLLLKFKNKYAILAGIVAATIINHLISAWFGSWLAGFLTSNLMTIIIALSFILVGFWLLIPDKPANNITPAASMGVFAASCLAFFVAEVGDKTQIATVLLAAKYHSIWLVMLGSTLGLVLANAPVLFLGEKIIKLIPLHYVRLVSCIFFICLGLFGLYRIYLSC